MNPLPQPSPEDEPRQQPAQSQNGHLPNFPNPKQDRPHVPKNGSIWMTLGGVGFCLLLCGGITLVGLYKVTHTAAQQISSNNMKQLLVGVHNYDSAFDEIVTDCRNEKGEPILSWRARIRCFLEACGPNYIFDHNIPWDQGKNFALSNQPDSICRHPPDKQNSINTPYQAFTGPSALLDPNRSLVKDKTGKMVPMKLETIPDGAENTIIIIEANVTVPYAQPIDINFPEGPTPVLGFGSTNYFLAAYADGHVRKIKSENILLPAFLNAIRYDDGPPPILN